MHRQEWGSAFGICLRSIIANVAVILLRTQPAAPNPSTALLLTDNDTP
jgi:hypothetical protein